MCEISKINMFYIKKIMTWKIIIDEKLNDSYGIIGKTLIFQWLLCLED